MWHYSDGWAGKVPCKGHTAISSASFRGKDMQQVNLMAEVISKRLGAPFLHIWHAYEIGLFSGLTPLVYFVLWTSWNQELTSSFLYYVVESCG